MHSDIVADSSVMNDKCLFICLSTCLFAQIGGEEFRDGLLSLQSLFAENEQFSESDVRLLMHHLDTDRDGFISYYEFFDSFSVADSGLAATYRESKDREKLRKQL